MGYNRADKAVLTFVSGEVTPLLDGRVDIEKVATGCRALHNMTVDEAGAAVRRRGLRYVASLKGYEPATGWYLVGQSFSVNGQESSDGMSESWTFIEE